MPVTHPHADRNASPAAVTVGTTTYPVASDGTIECPPEDAADVADVLADAYDVDAAALLDTATCDAVKSDGDICGRELPCPYHSEA